MMSRLIKRPKEWYAGWMTVDDADKNEITIRNRRQVAQELLQNVQEGHFDADTLEELNQVVDHECYYLKTLNKTKGQVQRNSKALDIPWTAKLFEELSCCLFQTIYPESYYERELQFRAMFSALILQRAQGIEGIQVDHHDEMRRLFQKGHKDLQWQKPWSGNFSKERFRKYQCSYVLVAISEYAKNFRREEPQIINILSSAIEIIAAGASIAIASTTGLGSGSLRDLITALDKSIQPLYQTPQQDYKIVFVLQELTRFTLALDLHTKIYNSKLGDKTASAPKVAVWVLKKILESLDKETQEDKVSQPKDAWKNFLAFWGNQPPRFSDYYYLYGLLDCATQLGRIIDRGMLPAGFEERMQKIIRNSIAPTLRWKAIEFLVLVKSWKDIDDPVIAEEVKVIKASIDEETGTLVLPPSIGRRPSRLDAPAISILERGELSPLDWTEEEENFPLLEIIPTVYSVQIPLAQKFLTKFLTKDEYYSAGFSPNCGSVFLLGNKNILVYSLQKFPDPLTKDAIKLNRIPRTKDEYDAANATLTNNFLALITKGSQNRLSVFKYGSFAEESFEVAAHSFDNWRPTCLTMYEATDRTWIAVGGYSSQNPGVSIKMYRVEYINGNFCLKKHEGLFEKCEPNGLKNDWPKVLEFSLNGRRLSCITQKRNKVLVWFLSNNARARQAAFEIPKSYEWGTDADGIKSVSLFHAPGSNRPYVLCTTSPSNRRKENGGEWPFISPVHSYPIKVPPCLEHPFTVLGKSAPTIASAVSPDGRLIAMLENSGTIILFRLTPSEKGGLCPSGDPVFLKNLLGKYGSSINNSCLRFYVDAKGRNWLFVVDVYGKVVRCSISGDSV